MMRPALGRALELSKQRRLFALLSWTSSLASRFFSVGLLLIGLFLLDLFIYQGTLPSFADLPERERQHFLQSLDKLSAETIDSAVQRLLPEDASAKKAPVTPREIELRRALLWWALVPDQVEHAVDYPAAVVRERFLDHYKRIGLDGAVEQDLRDMGALSLVVRGHSTWQNAPLEWLVSWNPWMTFSNLRCLVGLCLAGLLFALLRWGLAWLGQWFAHRAAMDIASRLRRNAYQHAARLSTLGFGVGGKSNVLVALAEIDKLRKGLVLWLTLALPEVVHAVLLLSFALFLQPSLTLILVILSGLVFYGMRWFRAMLRKRAEVDHRASLRQFGFLQESVEMIRLVRGYFMDAFHQKRIDRQIESLSARQLKQAWSESLAQPALALGILVVFFLVVFLAGLVLLQGFLEITALILLFVTLGILGWVVHRLLATSAALDAGEACAQAVFAFLDRKDTLGEAIDAQFLEKIERGIEFVQVGLRDPDTGKVLLRSVSFQIPAKQKIALVGFDDAEKLAVVSLLGRFLDPTQGQIRIDKKNLRWLTLESVRAQVAFVLQKELIFTDSVSHNISCGDPSYAMPKIIEAAKLAHAHQFISKLPKGYDALLGEGGQTLKAGEQFRIALARAILRDPAMLVIEEPRTAWDDDTKALIDDTLQRFLPGRTVLFVAHRLSTIRSCNLVVLLHQGKAAEQGEHRELMVSSDLYRHLQYLEFNEFANQTGGAT